MQLSKDIAKLDTAALLSVLSLIAMLTLLTGCAATSGKKSSGVVTSREATAIWHSYEEKLAIGRADN